MVQLLINLSQSLDFSHSGLILHHQRVALLSLHIGKALGFDNGKLTELLSASIIHDIGAVNWDEKLGLEKFDIKDPWPHCQAGYSFLNGASFIGSVDKIILHHHDYWEGNNPCGLSKDDIPLPSRIINLADRIIVLIKDQRPILDQRDKIAAKIKELSGVVFDPDLVAIFLELSKIESFWFNIVSPNISFHLINLLRPYHKAVIGIKELVSIARLFSQVVDAKSAFTYRHSTGVASTARFLAKKIGLPPKTLTLIEIAGLLHDLGKLTVPESILEKPGPLTRVEFNTIKQHPYYTYWWLKSALPKIPLAEWGAYHHEWLNGQGYPFHKQAEDLCTESRIIAIADIYTAMREERPYRSGLSWEQIEGTLNRLGSNGSLDPEIISVLFSHPKELDAIWQELTTTRQKPAAGEG